VLSVDVGEFRVVFSGGVLGDVEFLCFVVIEVTDTVFVIAGVPDFSGKLLANSEGVSAFYELKAGGGVLVLCRSDEDVEMVGHNDESVESEAALVAITKECGDHELCICGALEDSFALVREDGEGIGLELLADCSHDKRAYPEG
jgi:hypothetical protein